METQVILTIGNYRYAIKMWFEGQEGKWYEIWSGGNLLGERSPWPIDAQTREPLSKEALVNEKKRMLTEQQRRKEEAGRP